MEVYFGRLGPGCEDEESLCAGWSLKGSECYVESSCAVIVQGSAGHSPQFKRVDNLLVSERK